jgi:hypothetical protein
MQYGRSFHALYLCKNVVASSILIHRYSELRRIFTHIYNVIKSKFVCIKIIFYSVSVAFFIVASLFFSARVDNVGLVTGVISDCSHCTIQSLLFLSVKI